MAWTLDKVEPPLTPGSDTPINRVVEGLRAGHEVEENARTLFRHFYPKVLRFFLGHGFDASDAEDLAQDTLRRALGGLRTFRGTSSFESWLFAIAANLRRNALRTRTRHRANDHYSLDAETPDDAPARTTDLADERPSPEKVAYERQRLDALQRALGSLSEQKRRCLFLRLEKGLGYREIAAVLGVEINTVKSHLSQARQKLKHELGEELGNWPEDTTQWT